MAYRSSAGRIGLGLLLALGCLGVSARSARGDDAASPQAPPAAEKKRTTTELKELVGPVALYPDKVLSSLLPATTYPLQIVVAARWLRAQPPGGTVEAPASAAWDEHVKALLQLPDILYWLDENIEWVGQVGEALATQHADVLEAVEDVRAQAATSDKLKSEAPAGEGAQVVPLEGPAAGIVVEPGDPGPIWIPLYEPAPVILEQPWPVLGFGLGYGFGIGSSWLYSEPCWGLSFGLGWGCGGYGYGGCGGYGYGGWGGYGYGGCGGYGYGYGGCGGSGYGAVHNAGVRRSGAAALQGGGGIQGTRVAGGGAALSAGPQAGGRGAAGTRQQLAQQGSGVRPGPGASLQQGSTRSGTAGLGAAGTRSSVPAGLASSSRTAPGLTTAPGSGVRSGPVAGPWGRTQGQFQRGSSSGQARPYSIQGTRAGPATGYRSTLPSAYGAAPQRGTYPGRYSGSAYGAAQGRVSPQRAGGAYSSPGRTMSGSSSPGRWGASSYGGAQGFSSRGQASMGTRSMGGGSRGSGFSGGGFSGGSRGSSFSGGGFSGVRSGGGGGGRGGGGGGRRR